MREPVAELLREHLAGHAVTILVPVSVAALRAEAVEKDAAAVCVSLQVGGKIVDGEAFALA